MQEFKDIELVCVEETCETPGKKFILTAGEQRFMSGKVDEKTGKPFIFPKRCKDCREKRKNRVNSPFRGVADQFASTRKRGFENRRNKHGRERHELEENDYEGQQ